MALWGGRFDEGPADSVFALSRSVHFDWRLAPYDLVSSKAHLRGLHRNGIISDELAREIEAALNQLLKDVIAGAFKPVPEDEDVHSALERALLERLGEKGGALRAGRSRNDQVVTDLKLYLMDVVNHVMSELILLSQTILKRADEMSEVVAPGFTHIQHAQPINFGQELGKHAFALERDLSRLADWRKRAAFSPLGSGALAGSSLISDPEKAAKELGFDDIVGNSIDGVSDRDFVAEALFALSLIGSHLSRIGEEFTLWSSSEFSWVQVDDAYSTGSSIMPQKKNPDVAELARGKAGRLLGNLVTVMTVLKGLPFAYNRDLQEDKEPIFDSLDTLLILLPAVRGMIETARFDQVKISAGAIDGFALATEVADYLVRKGMPFAEAHEITGRVVRLAEASRLTLETLNLDQFKSINAVFDEDIFAVLSAKAAVDSRRSPMGTSATSIAQSHTELKARLEVHQQTVERNTAKVKEVLGQ